MLRTVNGEKIEITQESIDLIRAICDTPEGGSYDDIYQILEEHSGVTIDEGRATEVYKMHLVQSVLAAIGGQGAKKTIFSVRNKEGERRNWSLLVMPKEALEVVLGSYRKMLEKLQGKIKTLSQRVIEVQALIGNRTIELDDGLDEQEIIADVKKRVKTG